MSIRLSMGLLALILIQAALCGQGRYMKPEKGASLGLAGSIARNSDGRATAWTMYGTDSRNFEFGVSLSKTKAILQDEYGEPGENKMLNSISPYVEYFVRRDERHPISLALNLAYLRFIENEIDNHFLALSLSAFRDVAIDPNLTLIPEFGITKSIMTGASEDTPVLFNFGVGISIDMKKVTLLISPQLGIQDGKTSKGVSLSFVISPNSQHDTK